MQSKGYDIHVHVCDNLVIALYMSIKGITAVPCFK